MTDLLRAEYHCLIVPLFWVSTKLLNMTAIANPLHSSCNSWRRMLNSRSEWNWQRRAKIIFRPLVSMTAQLILPCIPSCARCVLAVGLLGSRQPTLLVLDGATGRTVLILTVSLPTCASIGVALILARHAVHHGWPADTLGTATVGVPLGVTATGRLLAARIRQ